MEHKTEEQRAEELTLNLLEETVMVDETSTIEPVEQPKKAKKIGGTKPIEDLLESIDQLLTAGELPADQDMKQLQRFIMNKKPNQDEASDEINTKLVAAINLKARYQEMKSTIKAEEREEREENLRKKEALLAQLEQTLSSTRDCFAIRNEKNIILENWKRIGPVPEAMRTKCLDRFSKLIDEFYIQGKLEQRDINEDYKNHKKEKEDLIIKAKALANTEDIIQAFQDIRDLNDRWKEVGPVAPEEKETLWKEFKDATTTITRKHDEYFRKNQERKAEALLKKKEIVEQLENLLIQIPTTVREWHTATTKHNALQREWKELGFIPKDKSFEISKRYKVATEEFDLHRKAFFREHNERIAPRFERLKEIVSEAEVLQESTQWKKTAEAFKALQKEWTELMSLGFTRRDLQPLWKKFRSASNKFFKMKKKDDESYLLTLENNLQKKLFLLDRMEATSSKEELEVLMGEWKSIGPVPKSKKDQVAPRYVKAKHRLERYNTPKEAKVLREKSKDLKKLKESHLFTGERASQPKLSSELKVGESLSSFSTEELQVERRETKTAIQLLEDELRKVEVSLSLFQTANPDNSMFAHLQEKVNILQAERERYKQHLEVIKQAIKSSSKVLPVDDGASKDWTINLENDSLPD